MRAARSVMGLVALTLWAAQVSACAHGERGGVRGAARQLARAAASGQPRALDPHVMPASRPLLDREAIMAGGSRGPWAQALREARVVEEAALLRLGAELPVRARDTGQGWRFAEDPTDLYAQSSPRQALRALVRASRAGRWDVMLRLAPRRYRIGLSEARLREAWTEAPGASELAQARDRLAAHLYGPITQDGHEAALDMGADGAAYLEREGERWVVVDF